MTTDTGNSTANGSAVVTANGPLAIGVDVGGTTIKFGLVTATGDLVGQHVLPTNADAGPDTVLDRIAEGIAPLLNQCGERLHGIGIGVPGVINNRGEICYPPNFPGWEIVHVASQIRTRLATTLPIAVENDANVAAYAEAATSTYRDFLYVTLGTGVGGAIIADGTIWRGGTGGAGEVGHVSVDMNGAPCNCGSRGCAEAYLGQRYMTAIAAEQLANAPHGVDSVLHTMMAAGAELSPRLLDEAAQGGDSFARTFLAGMGEILGAVLASALNLLDLHLVIVGGGIARSEQWLLDPARDSMRRRVLRSIADADLRAARYGNDAGMIGAALLALS